jgi:hypothetical protein
MPIMCMHPVIPAAPASQYDLYTSDFVMADSRRSDGTSMSSCACSGGTIVTVRVFFFG